MVLTENSAWYEAAEKVNAKVNCQLRVVRVGKDVKVDDVATWRKSFGLGATGATLIRPDGYVAWRAAAISDKPEQDLFHALSKVSFAR
nr:hypothetical protein [Pontibacter actiniarum]